MYERNTLRFASIGVMQVWETKAEQRSPQYPTCWEDLLEVSYSSARSYLPQEWSQGEAPNGFYILICGGFESKLL